LNFIFYNSFSFYILNYTLAYVRFSLKIKNSQRKKNDKDNKDAHTQLMWNREDLLLC